MIGLLDDVALEAGELALEPGDLLAVVTDGVTEALSPAETSSATSGCAGPSPGPPIRGRRAPSRLSVAEVDAWTGTAGCTDDLTALILRAT